MSLDEVVNAVINKVMLDHRRTSSRFMQQTTSPPPPKPEPKPEQPIYSNLEQHYSSLPVSSPQPLRKPINNTTVTKPQAIISPSAPRTFMPLDHKYMQNVASSPQLNQQRFNEKKTMLSTLQPQVKRESTAPKSKLSFSQNKENSYSTLEMSERKKSIDIILSSFRREKDQFNQKLSTLKQKINK